MKIRKDQVERIVTAHNADRAARPGREKRQAGAVFDAAVRNSTGAEFDAAVKKTLDEQVPGWRDQSQGNP